eukprot:1182359-Prorocentrum_minimum.AAC.3
MQFFHTRAWWQDYYYPSLTSGAAEGGGGAAAAPKPFYLAPVKRYYYWTPKALVKESEKTRVEGGGRKKRGHRGALGERTSPFLSFWYCGLGEMQREVVAIRGLMKDSRCELVMNTSKLPPVLKAV